MCDGNSPVFPMIKSLAHLCLYTHDLAATEDFYCGALGLKIKFRFLKDGALYGYYIQVADSQFIEVFYREERASGVPQIGHICLETDDIQQMRAQLTEKGVKTTEPKLGADNSWQMWLHAPEGTAIEFHQYTPTSTQHTGEDCIVNW